MVLDEIDTCITEEKTRKVQQEIKEILLELKAMKKHIGNPRINRCDFNTKLEELTGIYDDWAKHYDKVKLAPGNDLTIQLLILSYHPLSLSKR